MQHGQYLPNSSYATKISTFGKHFKDSKLPPERKKKLCIAHKIYLFRMGAVNPRALEVMNLSMGKPVPANAQAPRGQKLILVRQSSKRNASRSSYKTRSIHSLCNSSIWFIRSLVFENNSCSIKHKFLNFGCLEANTPTEYSCSLAILYTSDIKKLVIIYSMTESTNLLNVC